MEAADFATAGERVAWILYFAALNGPSQHSWHRVDIRTYVQP